MLLANMTIRVKLGVHNTTGLWPQAGSDFGSVPDSKVVYDKHGVTPDTGFVQDLGVAERSNSMEDWVVMV